MPKPAGNTPASGPALQYIKAKVDKTRKTGLTVRRRNPDKLCRHCGLPLMSYSGRVITDTGKVYWQKVIWVHDANIGVVLKRARRRGVPPAHKAEP